jgi:glutathione peroxidase
MSIPKSQLCDPDPPLRIHALKYVPPPMLNFMKVGLRTSQPARGVGSNMTLNEIPLVTIDGEPTSLAPYADKVKLIVNVASRCGLSPQYKKLEELQETYGDRGFTVLGFPSNQFLQELGSSAAIKEFCSTTYGVTFPMFERIRVNGRSQHPLYAELTKTPDAAGKAGRIKWNFEKFIVTPSGEVHRFRPQVEPDAPEILSLIESSLHHPADERPDGPPTTQGASSR